MKMSPVTKEQWLKVLKAIGYSFVSTFVVFIASSNNLNKTVIYAAAVAGFNAVMVTVKQLFTEGK